MRSRMIIASTLTALVLWLSSAQIQGAGSTDSDRITYYHHDALGSIVAATDQQGQALWRADYQPYGVRHTQGDGPENGLWFSGKPHEEATGLSYFGARWYDPVVGRFTGIDPVDMNPEEPHSFNRYAYANNNPYKYIDPDGNLPVFAIATFIAKELAGGLFEQTTGLPVPTVKGVGKKIGKELRKNLLSTHGKVSNPVPRDYARVVPGNLVPKTLGRPGDPDIFITDANVLKGLNAKEIAKKLTIPESSTGFKVIEFPSKNVTMVASPVNRTNPGFVGGGRTAGGAPEFVVPNGNLPLGSKVRLVP